MLTSNERAQLLATSQKLADLREFLLEQTPPDLDSPIEAWFSHLLGIRMILGNFSNNLSLAACLMAKAYLEKTLPMRPFDVALKPQSAPGLDFDELTVDGDRVIGELKTTIPYAGRRFGAAQAASLKKDFAKLQANEAEHKFLFVTDNAAALELNRSYSAELEGVTIVCLAIQAEAD